MRCEAFPQEGQSPLIDSPRAAIKTTPPADTMLSTANPLGTKKDAKELRLIMLISLVKRSELISQRHRN
jgi:hypothetical protein